MICKGTVLPLGRHSPRHSSCVAAAAAVWDMTSGSTLFSRQGQMHHLAGEQMAVQRFCKGGLDRRLMEAVSVSEELPMDSSSS